MKVQDSPARFDARLPFDPLIPYEDMFRERVPLVQALHVALGNYIAARSGKRDLSGARTAAIAARVKERAFGAAECGVYLGNALVATARILTDAGVRFKVYGLDTFAGLPKLSAKDRSLAPPGAKYLSRTLFADTSMEAVREKLHAAGLERNVTLLQGLFEATLPELPDRRYHFVNIDCDLYEPHLECLQYFYPRMEPGGVIFFDDYHSVHYPMARKAIDEFMRDKPEKLFFLRYGEDGPNLTKAFLVKF